MADSDSENEGILNNIQRLVIRPPGHTGKAKKGHICFDGGYETMNLGRVDFITNQEYDLFIRPDTANPRARLWFHFTVENTQKDQRVIFNVVNLSKWRTLFAEGLTPVVKSTSRPRWQRMQHQFVFYYQSPIHSDHFVLSFAFTFDREDERYSFALSQPYSLSRYNLYLEAVLASKFDFVRCETLATSIQERPLHLLTITEPGNDDGRQKPVIFVMGRIHASEAPSSFILQGLIDFLVSNHAIAQDLRQYIVFKLIPVMNPDGVFLGNTMGNLLGQDLNRCWDAPNPFSQPTVHAVRQAILKLNQDPESGLDMIIDVHSHASLLGLFIVGNSYDDVYRFERHVVFPKIMAQICPDFSLENTIYNDDEAKKGTARRYFCSALASEVNSYTLEASLYGYVDPESDPLLPIIVPYTDDMYCRIGRNLARALWDYYKILNLIPIMECSSVATAQLAYGAVRSFNLLRLKRIEEQRNQAAVTFDADHQLSCVDHKPLKDEAGTARPVEARSRRRNAGHVLNPSLVYLQLHHGLCHDPYEGRERSDLVAAYEERLAMFSAESLQQSSLRDWTPSTSPSFPEPLVSLKGGRITRTAKTSTSSLVVRGQNCVSKNDCSSGHSSRPCATVASAPSAAPDHEPREIAVSGLTINSSDCRDDFCPPTISPSAVPLIKPAGRKIGGGGFVSLSAFQEGAPRVQPVRLPIGYVRGASFERRPHHHHEHS